jgi:hypothetical protein
MAHSSECIIASRFSNLVICQIRFVAAFYKDFPPCHAELKPEVQHLATADHNLDHLSDIADVLDRRDGLSYSSGSQVEQGKEHLDGTWLKLYGSPSPHLPPF